MNHKVNYEKIKALRQQKGLRQSEMAEKLHVVTSAYNKIENGKREIRVNQLEAIALALGVQLDDLIKERNLGQSGDQNFEVKMRRVEVDFLESALRLVGRELEQLIIGIYHNFEIQYTLYELNYVDFLADYHPAHNIDYAVQMLKERVLEYERYIADPQGWNDARIAAFSQFIKMDYHQTTFDDEYPWFTEDDYLLLKNQSDQWLRDFAINENNWEFIHNVMSDGMQGCYHTYPDRLKAFRDMLDARYELMPFFKMGLLDGSFFDSLWKDYCLEGFKNVRNIQAEEQQKYDALKKRMSYIISNENIEF